MQDILASLIQEYLPQIVIGVLGVIGTILGKHARRFLKANTNEKQRAIIKDVVSDVYGYVEREYGDKIKKSGEEKFKIGLDMFERKMEENEIPVNADEFQTQIERLIREEKKGALQFVEGIIEEPSEKKSNTEE